MNHADYQNPFESVKFISCFNTDQIGAFPYGRHFIDTDTELARFLPVFQILGCIKLCVVAGCQNKAPAVLFVIPEDARITEIRCARVFDHRVAIIFFKMFSLIQTVCNTLLLQACFHIVRRVDSHHRFLTVFRKSAAVIFIVCHTSGVHRSDLIRVQCDRLMLPVNQVFRYCMTPVHRSPYNVIWVMLIIQMPDTIDINQSVRIVVPVFLRCKMNLWSEVSFSLFTHVILFSIPFFLYFICFFAELQSKRCGCSRNPEPAASFCVLIFLYFLFQSFSIVISPSSFTSFRRPAG